MMQDFQSHNHHATHQQAHQLARAPAEEGRAQEQGGAAVSNGKNGIACAWNTQPIQLTALEAWEYYGWSVFPLDQEKKPPHIGGTHPDGTERRLSWKSYQRRAAPKELLLSWTQRYSPAAWGVITGILSSVIVLDFDGEAGKSLLDALGFTAHVQTGSGGYHLYVTHPGWPVKTLNGKAAQELGRRWPGLDIRGDGGYAVFCGRNQQGPYVWLRDPTPEPFSLLPDELRACLETSYAPTRPSPPHRREPRPLRDPSDPSPLLEQARRRAAQEGRNNAGFWLARQLREQALPETAARGLMSTYARSVSATNTKGQHEPYTEREALATLRSAYQYTQQARELPPARAHARTLSTSTVSGEVPMSTGHLPTIHLSSLPVVSLEEVVRAYSMGEWGDALLFARLFARQCVYDHYEKAWYLWCQHYWQRDDVGRVRRSVSGQLASVYLRASATLNDALHDQRARLLLRDLPKESGEQEGEQDEQSRLKKLVKGLAQRAFALRAVSRNSNVLTFACSHEQLAITSEVWDASPWLLGTRLGVLDLRTGQLRDGQPEDYVRTIIPTTWRGLEAPAPRFLQFLQEIFVDRTEEERADLLSFLQRVLGYGLLGTVSEHLFLLLYGEEGRNGKDTLMGALQDVLGATVGAVSNDVIIANGKMSTPGSAKPHLCALQGKRIAWASETDKEDRFDIGQVKFLTGGGTIAARQLYGKEYTFAPSHLLVLLTNNKPHADPKDKAFWERICPIAFQMRFVDHPSGPHERQKDGRLGAMLREEASGILAWLVRGCLAWQQQGLPLPPSILRERANYREEEDILAQFIADCCIVSPQAQVKSSALFERYKQWAEANVMKKIPGTAFGQEMKRRYQQRRTSQGTSYLGIGLASFPTSTLERRVSDEEEGHRPERA